jgi:transposase
MKAIHGGTAQNDQSDSHKIAALLRGGMLPQADVSPAERRATRDLLRRRTPLMRKRPDLLAHVQNTNSQYHVPEIGKQIAYTANRAGVAERCADPAVHKTLAVDLALMTSDDEVLRALERSIVHTAKPHDAQTLYLLQTVPGIGTILSLGLRYAIHRLDRFPSVQAFAASCRRVTCRKASGGKHVGPSGKNSGPAHLTWAFAEAAALFLRHNAAGQKYRARLEKKHDKGTALRILAHTLGRAVYDLRKRTTAFAMALFLRTSESRAGELAVSLATQGMRLHCVCPQCLCTASGNAQARLGPCSLRLTR